MNRPGGSRPVLTLAQSALLQHLRQVGQPVRATVVVAHFGQHVNTVRGHLDDLVAIGLARRRRASAVGRGRPPWLYEVDSPEPADGT